MISFLKPRKRRSLKEKLYYLYLRFQRLRDNPHKVALGVAISLFINWLPLLGLHTLLIILVCWVFRANILAGLLASFLGNPWTLPAMFWADYMLGLKITQALDFSFSGIVPHFMTHIVPAASLLWLERVFFTALLGAIPLATATAFVSYGITYQMVRQWRKISVPKTVKAVKAE